VNRCPDPSSLTEPALERELETARPPEFDEPSAGAGLIVDERVEATVAVGEFGLVLLILVGESSFASLSLSLSFSLSLPPVLELCAKEEDVAEAERGA
jgi:hypothetical protein